MGNNSEFFNRSSDRTRIAGGFRNAVAQHRSCWCFMSVYWIWTLLALQGVTLLPPVMLVGQSVPLWLLPVFAMAASSLGIALYFKRTRKVFRGRGYFVFLVATTYVGTILVAIPLVLEAANPSTALMLYATGSLFLGVGTSFFNLEMTRYLGYLGAQQTLYCCIAGALVTGLLSIPLSLASMNARLVILVVIPAAMALLLRNMVRRVPKTRYYDHGVSASLTVPRKYVASSLIQGFAYGFMFGNPLLSLELPTSVDVVSFLVAAVLMLGSLLFVRLDFNQLVYKVGFPLMALGFLASSLHSTALVGATVCSIGFSFTVLAFMGIGSYLIKDAGMPASWITALPNAFFFFGQAAGALLGTDIAETPSFPESPFFAASFMACVLLGAALYMSSGHNLKYGWGVFRPGDKGAVGDPAEQTCAFLINEHHLTPRESEVLYLLAEQKRRKTIAEELVVSEETVKTHIRGVYKKLLVHSQPELTKLIADTEKLLMAKEDLGDDRA
ncbi:response regulator transcription factor [Adlercreutzia caecimuris]|uniref:response regulator transcription factor n=1 Tax=Adlercreutzia caecimuris TaxID=671266 RepID=UPI00257050FC|nr:LuxR family transcriptional regulator [Adlercreutzia caecimuris]